MTDDRDLHPRVPLTSIASAAPDGSGGVISRPWELYLSAVSRQARIALLHLDAVWSFEGDPADPNRWYGTVDEDWLWSELQGAMTACIIIARLLRPGRVFDASAQVHADERGVRLRELLDVAEESPLLTVHGVRNAIEHVDERLDSAVLDPSVFSVSQGYVARGMRFQTPAVEAVGRGRHRNLALFAPDAGLLIFDDDTVDLWALEVALHNLLAEMPGAYNTVLNEVPRTRMGFGSGRMRVWSNDLIHDRRNAIADARSQIRASGKSALRLVGDPRTVVWRQIDAPDNQGADDQGETP